MSQISTPVRILLVGAIVFLAAYVTVLRPKSETEAPPATSTTTPAAGAATATPATSSATTSAPEVKPESAGVAAIPADVLAKLPKTVAGALKERKVLVLGVLSEDSKPWRPAADDDRYVRHALKRANRYDGGVVIKTVGLDQISTYGPLVNDLGVTQSPSIVVIDRNLKGTVLTGYVDRVAINQAIADARRESITPNIKNPYLHDANSLCGHYETRLDRWSLPTIRGRKAEVKALERYRAILSAYGRKIAALDAPAKYQSLRTLWLKDEKARLAAWDKVVETHKSTRTGYAKTNAAIEKFNVTWNRRLDRRFNEVGLTDCATVRTA